MQHHDGDVVRVGLRYLELNVHLVDLDVVRVRKEEATRCPGRGAGVFGLTPDEEASLGFQHQWTCGAVCPDRGGCDHQGDRQGGCW